VSYVGGSVRRVVKIDVQAVAAMLDEMLAVPGRSPFEELEPDYEFLEPADCPCSCHTC
jgi:hypothetical protein